MRLLWRKQQPLLLALSRAPLAPGAVGLAAIGQLLTSFAWDEGMAAATLLLPESVAQACPASARFVTLCVVTNAGLEVVGESARLDELAAKAPRLAVSPWRQLPAAVRSHLAGQLLLDGGLLQQAGEPAASRAGGGWQAAVHAGDAQAVVELLAPGPIHADAVVKVAVADGQLTVTLAPGAAGGKAKKKQAAAGSSGDGGGALQEGRFSMALPAGAADGPPAATKLARSMGVLCMRVALAATTAG